MKSKDYKKSSIDATTNAIPQHIVVYAVSLSGPPAISDEVPEQMPFSTDGQDRRDDDSLVDELLATNQKFRALVERSKMTARKPFSSQPNRMRRHS
jgi:hypothetical protein